MTRDATRGIAAAGILRIVSMFGLVDVATGEKRALAAVGHMGAGARQERGVQIFNRLVTATLARDAGAVRVYLHPQNFTHETANRAVRQVAEFVAHGYPCVTFDEL
jgi:hypothetical protein